MKKIINGKKYDTETAEYVDRWSNDLCVSDCNWCIEDLYRKKTGEFFLYGEGGGLSRYRTRLSNNSFCEGCSIIPMTEDDAKAWVEKHLSYEDYVRIFGEPEE